MATNAKASLCPPAAVATQQPQIQGSCVPNFAFAFDNPAFSDRILKLTIFHDSMDQVSEISSLIDWMKSVNQRNKENPESKKEFSVKTLHISTLVFAANSPFFLKLFSNTEENKNEVILCIDSSEEAPLMNVIKFMHNQNLPPGQTHISLLDMLLVAHKFDVPSCVNYCCNRLLASYPMTAELALAAIHLNSIVSIKSIQPLVTAAQKFLPNILKDISIHHGIILNLSLEGIKTILSRDDLKMESEDEIYALFKEWVAEQYPTAEEQKRVVSTELSSVIRLQYLSPQKLNLALAELFNDNNSNNVRAVSTALLSTTQSKTTRNCRPYTRPPVSSLTFEAPVKQCVAFLDLKRSDLLTMTGFIDSQTFVLGDHIFYLKVTHHCGYDGREAFGLYLCYVKDNSTVNVNLCYVKDNSTVNVKYEFGVRKKWSSRKFTKLRRAKSHNFQQVGYTGYGDLFGKNSVFFINDCMHLRATITLI